MTQTREWSSTCSRRFPGADTLGVMRRFVGPTLELRGRSRARVRFLSGRVGYRWPMEVGMDHVEVGGLRVTYRQAGQGPPLVLLHGGLGRVIGSRLVVMPGVGHQSGMEAPDRFNAEVRGFLRSVLMSRAGTPRRRENRGGLPADAGAFLVVEAVESVWRRGLDLDGSRTVLGARGSDFRFPDRGPRAALCVWPR